MIGRVSSKICAKVNRLKIVKIHSCNKKLNPPPPPKAGGSITEKNLSKHLAANLLDTLHLRIGQAKSIAKWYNI
jgi:hypothetical protein